jgi:hypothetical protein
VRTPDGHEEQDGAGEDSPAKPLLRTTTWAGHRPGAFERVLYNVSSALRPLIAARLSEEHSFLFAEPVTDPETGEVHWYSPVEGEAVPYVDLVPEDQAAVDGRVNKLLFDLMELARKLQAEPKTLEDHIMGQLLELQLDSSYSEKECLYLVGYQPVFAFWAFESGHTPAAFEPPATAFPQREQPAKTPAEDGGAAAPTPARQRAPLRLRLPRISGSPRQLGIVAAILLIAFVGIFGLSPRATVVSWLDRVQTIRAHEEALLRIIARDERARVGGTVSPEDIEAELKGAQPAAVADTGPVAAAGEAAEVAEAPPEAPPEPLQPFEGAKGSLPADKVPGSILVLHFWSSTDPDFCQEITSFVSMVTDEGFDAIRELGGEAYLVTDAASLDEGNELLKTCGVQDPLPLRDPGGLILRRMANAKAPQTVIYDKQAERVLATYPRRDWLEPAALQELQKLFLMQAF